MAVAVEEQKVAWRPHRGAQTRALASPAYETLMGGGAGGGKSALMAIGALRYITNPNYQAIIFRRTFPELERTLIRFSLQHYSSDYFKGDYNSGKHVWTFPSGAKIFFSHLDTEDSVQQHKGAEYQYIAFDELTEFTESQYRFLLSRGRSPHGIPIRIRATCNPQPGWVKKRWAPWVDKKFPQPAVSGEVRFLVADEQGEDVWVPRDHPGASTRSFVKVMLPDNPTLHVGDPTYERSLKLMDPIQRRRLLEGDWDADYAAGLVFKRTSFGVVEAMPENVIARVRCWDLAATEEKLDPQNAKKRASGGKGDPDYTVGVRYAMLDDLSFVVEDVIRERVAPAALWKLLVATASQDGKGIPIGIEQEGGASGKIAMQGMSSALASMGYAVFAMPTSGDKVTRAQNVSASAGLGVVRIRRAAWNLGFLDELESFPDGQHDDQVDALAHAHNLITSLPRGSRRDLTWLPPA